MVGADNLPPLVEGDLRRWFDNEYDRSPTAERMYIDELREFQAFLVESTDVVELKTLNLLGVQFALCDLGELVLGMNIKVCISHVCIIRPMLYARYMSAMSIHTIPKQSAPRRWLLPHVLYPP